MKRPVSVPVQGLGRAANPDVIGAEMPHLAETLTSLTYDDDPPTARETATLLIFAQDGTWRACLRDRQEKRCLWVSSATWEDLLPVLDAALGDPNAVWREDRMGGAEGAKRIKPSGK